MYDATDARKISPSQTSDLQVDTRLEQQLLTRFPRSLRQMAKPQGQSLLVPPIIEMMPVDVVRHPIPGLNANKTLYFGKSQEQERITPLS